MHLARERYLAGWPRLRYYNVLCKIRTTVELTFVRNGMNNLDFKRLMQCLVRYSTLVRPYGTPGGPTVPKTLRPTVKNNWTRTDVRHFTGWLSSRCANKKD